MKKLVPDPPLFTTLKQTGSSTFGCTDTHRQPLFAVREGFNAEEALVQVAFMLSGAIGIADEIEHLNEPDKRLFLTMVHTVETANAVVEALLNGARLD